ncbi:phage terminase small subunit [Shewanella sp.]|uniref:phage terminase small subunit n=1 Tax=Gammaproteobacteria TaxID=1236 RepID=UPI001B616874|nr:phage terminase small subunit [Shewanella sp.]MBP6518330.1 hypothetical protein [Shewanella sp.]
MEQLTPAQQHWRKTMAERRGDEQTTENMTAYDQILHRLRHDQTRLSYIQGTEFKIEYKKTILDQYEPWIDGVLSANTGQSDEVFTTVLVWQIDCENYDRALDMADYVLAYNLPLPERYNRTPATMVIDEICDKALTLFAASVDKEKLISINVLERLNEITKTYDVPNEVRAKLYKSLAYTLRLNDNINDKSQAVELMQSALLLHEKVGVKRDIELLQREIKKVSVKQDDTPPVEPVNVEKSEPKKATATKATTKKTTTTRKKAAS